MEATAATDTEGTAGQMYRYQDSLPRLPIPELEDTCKRYIAAVAPLLTEDELEGTRSAVDAFLTGDGLRLQAELKAYAENRSSYVSEFWYDTYLSAQASVAINMNPYFVLADDPIASAGADAQVTRASSLVVSALHFAARIRDRELEPDMWRGKPLCMHQYDSLFGCARMPVEAGFDTMAPHGADARHVVVIARGFFYYFDVLWPDGTVCVSEAQIGDNLRCILADADAVYNSASAADALASSLGVLTTEARCKWAAARKELCESDANREALHVVDSALFVLCLDDDEPTDAGDIARAMLHGSYRLRDGVQCGSMINRWYDKLQIIVCKNGAAGVNFEHTRVDGHTVLRFVSDVFADTIMRFAAKITTGVDSKIKSDAPTRLARHGSVPMGLSAEAGVPETWPHRLEWEVGQGTRLRQRIHNAEVRLADLVSQHDTAALEFDRFGKAGIVRAGVSPDAFVQLALMATYFSLWGEVVCVYEPVQTKSFLHGRTEAARTMTAEAVKFVRTWASGVGDEAKLSALRAALGSLGSLVRLAAQGQGVDRHLFALFCIWQQRPGNTATGSGSAPTPPPLFADKGWSVLKHSVLSTSNCGNPALRLFGFGPVAADGFGIGYVIKDHRIAFCVSSKHRQTERFLHTLQRTLVDMREVLVAAHLRHKRKASGITGGSYGFFDEDEESEGAMAGPAGRNGSLSSVPSGLGPRQDSPLALPLALRPGKRLPSHGQSQGN